MATKSVTIDNKSFDISYEVVNPSSKKDIIFLHGWGSNKDIMKNVFSPYLKDFRHIYIDLPGFGKSLNNYVLTTNDYVKIVDEFLNLITSSKDIIAGHSYGGKVATLLNPKKINFKFLEEQIKQLKELKFPTSDATSQVVEIGS